MKNLWYWYYFEDGYRLCVKGLSVQELRAEEREHGKLLYKVKA